jgi:hypothetical protein
MRTPLHAAAALWLLCAAGCAAAPRPAAPPDLTRHLGRRWYGIYFLGGKIGWAESEISEAERRGKPAVVVRLALTARVEMQNVPQEMSIDEERVYVLDEGLESFADESRSFGATTRIAGRREGDRMRVTSIVGGEKREELIDLPPERFEDYLAEERLVGGGAGVGDEISFSQYQPRAGRTVTAVSRVAAVSRRPLRGIPTELYTVETTLKEMGISSRSLLTASGDVLETQVGGVFTMRIEDEKSARSLDYRSDVVLSSAIRTGVKIVDPARVRVLRAALRGVNDRALLVESERQSYTRGPGGELLLTVRIEDLSGVAPPRLPIPRSDFPRELSPGLFIQSGSRTIAEKARQIVGAERDARAASDLLVRWVHGNLAKRFSASFSNALDVLQAGGGDCTEHSVLYVALARAAGLPAREVSGIVYCDDGFYYHQWAEAFVGKWIAVDPTFGQTQADATHIRFAEGDLLSQARLLNLIGALSIDILDYSHEGNG